MASPKAEAVALELPKGTLLVGTVEKDGVVTETKAFTVGPGVVTVCVSGNGVKRIEFKYGARIESILEDGQIVRGVLAEGSK